MRQSVPLLGKKSIRKKVGHLLALFLLVFGQGYAQTVVSGKVSSQEDGSDLPGVSVIIEGSTKGTVTDLDGNYKISVPGPETVLTYSYVGFAKSKVPVGSQSVIDVAMKVDIEQLEEVVVVGYGEQKKKELTGAVARMDGEVLKENATADILTAMQGRIAGVSIQASSGEPGAAANITIRGIGSTTGYEGSNSPLFVIDGIPWPQGEDPKLSPNEIETIDVLKDAGSAAVYGVRGAGGVILITTKMAKEGEARITLNSWRGVQNITSGIPLMNAEEHLYASFQRIWNRGVDGNWSNTWTDYTRNPSQLTNDTNVYDLIVVDNAPTQNHSLNISGGQENLSFNLTGTYFTQEGSLTNSNYKRLNIRANTRFVKDKWVIRAGLGLRREDRRRYPFGFYNDAIRYNPTQNPIDPNATVIEEPGASNNDIVASGGLMSKILRDDESDENHMNINLSLEREIIKGLKFNSRIGASTTDNERSIVYPYFERYDNEGEIVPQDVWTRSRVEEQSFNKANWSWENFVNYSMKFQDHKFDLTALASADEQHSRGFSALRYDLLSNDVTVLDAATDATPSVGSYGDNLYNRNRTTHTLGFMGRINYSYKNGRYIISGAVRRDGSSRFGSDHKWGTFPSISAAWNVADEPFFQPLANTISSFKFRASYGSIGNQGIPDYQYQATIESGHDYVFNTGTSQYLAIGAASASYPNEFIQWEEKTEVNVGIDLGMFDNKFQLETNIYRDNRNSLLASVQPPLSTGTTDRIIINTGDLVNEGIELSASYNKRGTVDWSLSGVYTKNVNTIENLPQDDGSITFFGGSEVVQGVPGEVDVIGLQEGAPAGSYFLYKSLGVIKNEEQLEAYQALGFAPGAKLGDMMYADINGDSLLNIEDRVASGSGAPDFEIGLSFNAEYKGFDFSMQWFGAFGAEIMNGSKAYAYKEGRHRDLLYAWTPQNPESNIAADQGRDHLNHWGFTDRWLEDGTYIRLRTISLGYTLPHKITEIAGLERFRVYVSAQNPITITDYTGFDPEVGNNGLTTRGLDRGTYPVSATYRVGIEIGL